MKTTVFGNALVITSALKAEEIKLAAKYRPEALNLYDEEKVPYFAVGTTAAAGTITNSGIYFDGVSRDGNGYATLTLGFKGGSTDPNAIKEEVADKFGTALARLAVIEQALPPVLDEIAAQKATVIAGIEVE